MRFLLSRELYALCVVDQNLFLLMPQVSFTSQAEFALLSPSFSLGMYWENGRASPSLPAFPTALESVSFTSWQWTAAGFPACLLCRQETQRRCLGDWGQLSQWHGLCSTPPGPPPRALGSHVSNPGPPTHRDLPAPILLQLHQATGAVPFP